MGGKGMVVGVMRVVTLTRTTRMALVNAVDNDMTELQDARVTR